MGSLLQRWSGIKRRLLKLFFCTWHQLNVNLLFHVLSLITMWWRRRLLSGYYWVIHKLLLKQQLEVENKLKCRLFRPQNMFPLSFIPSDINSGPENSEVFLHRVDEWLLHHVMDFRVAFLDAVAVHVKWQQFSKYS